MRAHYTLLGTIEEHEGAICLRTLSGRTWYPLEGNSGIAADFCEAFTAPQKSDVGRKLYRVKPGGHLAMDGS